MIEAIGLDDDWVTPADADRRWDRANLRDLDGTYGEWLTAKVSKVFPDLAQAVIDGRKPGLSD